MDFTAVLNQVPLRLDPLTKGLAPGLVGLDRAKIAAQGVSLFHDLPLPVATLKLSTVQRNSLWMAQYLQRAGASFAPHGKTTMSPELFALQQADGCWGLTLATVHQVRVARRFGVQRILLANEVVGFEDIRYLLDELAVDPQFELFLYVDSVQGARRLDQVARVAKVGRPLNLLLEVGHAQGRAGVRNPEQVQAVVTAVLEAGDTLALRGVSGFEGLYQGRRDEDRLGLVAAFLQRLCDAAAVIDAQEGFAAGEIILSAGGSSYYDQAVAMFGAMRLSQPVRVVTRSGCYLTHDDGLYANLQAELLARDDQARKVDGALSAGLEVWGQVLSRPEPGLIIVSAGRRDFGTDAGLPRPLRHKRPGIPLEEVPPGCVIEAVSDQHAHVRVPVDSHFAVGDVISLGVSHPCTTFDKWRLLYLVDDDYRVANVVQTFF
ncbi:amino acid deaminase [Pseudomonas putida]|uniref:amino acid deaminase n=1 Tax=Pseudomonas putida TaxID=303 RepID=UPI00383B222D